VKSVVGSLLLTFLAFPLWTRADERHKTPKVVEQAIKIRQEYEAHGKRLVDKLNDTTLTTRERSIAALDLAKLHYSPAIPSLIKHLDLKEDKAPATADDPARGYSCVQALSQFESDVIAPIIVQYVEEDSEDRRRLLSVVLLKATGRLHRADAIRYARGYGFELSERSKLDRLIELYRLLHKDLADKPAIPKAWLKDE
jgi:hypothetical protein